MSTVPKSKQTALTTILHSENPLHVTVREKVRLKMRLK